MATDTTYVTDPFGTDTSTTYIANYLGYSNIEKIGTLRTSTTGAYSINLKECWLGWAYNYSFSGTWPSSIKLTVTGQAVAFFNEAPTNPYSTVSNFGLALLQKNEAVTNSLYTQFCDGIYAHLKSSTTSTSFGRWWVLTPFKGAISRTFSIDSSEVTPSLTLKIKSNIWSYEGLAGTATKFTGAETGYLVFSYTRPSMTLSASNVSTASATINIKSHTNPMGYWRYKPQWKLSTASTWSSGSVFSLTASTSTKTLSTLTAGATYNYRIAYLDKNDNIVSYSSTLSFTVPEDQATVYVNSGGSIKKAKVWYNNGGTIKKVKNIYYNNSGTIKSVKK